MKTITFLLPSGALRPVGGIKVAYEYGNRLVKDGFRVIFVYPAYLKTERLKSKDLLKSVFRYLLMLFKGFSGKKWFNLDPRITHLLVPSLRKGFVPDTYYYVATSVDTAYYLEKYNIPIENKLYLIQDFEDWGVTTEYVTNSYLFGFKNIVISNWLAKKVSEVGASFHLIPNGFDFEYFKYDIPVEKKDRFKISMLYHNDKRKGCEYGMEALRLVKNEYPQLKAMFFGVPERPKDLPEWIEYYQTPDRETHNRIYNECSINLAPSLQEGWGLTVGEAMICGEAIICTDTLGFQEMVKDGENGFIVPIKSPELLAAKIIQLLNDDQLRQQMAQKAITAIQKFRWEESYLHFKKLFD